MTTPARGRDLRVVLVEPKYSGNVGSVARLMANYGVEELVLVNPPELTREARYMAVHAYDRIERARHAKDLDEAVEGTELVLGFTALTSGKGQDHLRLGLSLPDAVERVRAADGRTSLVFGREDKGLFNPELARCDVVTQIPVDPGYPSINLSHAVGIALYELVGRGGRQPFAPRAASEAEIERLLATLDHLCREARFPDHKVEPAVLAVRRLLGRARVSVWDYHRLMGILSETLKTLGAWPPPAERWSPEPDDEEAGEG